MKQKKFKAYKDLRNDYLCYEGWNCDTQLELIEGVLRHLIFMTPTNNNYNDDDQLFLIAHLNLLLKEIRFTKETGEVRTVQFEDYMKLQKEFEDYFPKKKIINPKPLPDVLYKFDGTDIYNLDKTEYIDEFIEEYGDHVFGGGLFAMPISSLDRYHKGANLYLELVGQVSDNAIDKYNLCRPFINGKMIYQRLVYKIRDEFLMIERNTNEDS